MAESPYRPEEIILQKEEYAYGFIMEVLTTGLYPDKLHVIREYIQNAYDAVLAWRRITGKSDYGRIEVKVASPSLVIYDDGVGMDLAKINQYRYVGYSEKRTSEGVGFRGIGKLSGISVAEKLIVTSSPAQTPERYKLIFDAQAMRAKILELKSAGENVPLNELIRTHTTITVEPEDSDLHYTLVELYNVHSDSRMLMQEQELARYIGRNTPVGFDPRFEYGAAIDEWLREHVRDYGTAPVVVNGEPVYKPFPSDLKTPQMIFVLDEPPVSPNGEEHDDSDSELLAFCWYCEHTQKGQLPDKSLRGLCYRLKNFAVGDSQLPRQTLWTSSPERAFYFFGEIHVCDPEVVPSSERGNFEQNSARERLYRQGAQISKSLNRIAGRSSDQRRAHEYIVRAERIVTEVQAGLDSGTIPRELKVQKTASVYNAIEAVKKRRRHVTDEFRPRGERVVSQGERLLTRFEAADSGKAPQGFYDITHALQLDPQAARVYHIIVACLRRELGDKAELYEHLLKQIHAALQEDIGSNQ